MGKTSYRNDSLLYYHLELEDLIEESDNINDKLNHIFQKGRSNFFTSNISEAEIHFQALGELAKEHDNSVHQINALNFLGHCNSLNGKNYLALENYLAAEKIALKINDSKSLCDLKLNLGILYRDQEEFEDAIDYFKQRIDCLSEFEDSSGIATAYMNLGNTYHYQGKDLDKSREYLMKALEYGEKWPPTR